MIAKIRQDGSSLYIEVYEAEGDRLAMSWHSRPLVLHLDTAPKGLQGATNAYEVRLDSICNMWLRFGSSQAAAAAIPAAQTWMDRLIGGLSS